MATTFKTIRDYIRAALLDHDTETHQYSDNALNSQIRFSILTLNDEAVYLENGGQEKFTGDLTSQQKLILALEIAIRILSGTPNNFSYKSPVLSVHRRGGVSELISVLEIALDAAQGGRFAIETDTDFDIIIQSFDRFTNGLSSAYSY